MDRAGYSMAFVRWRQVQNRAYIWFDPAHDQLPLVYPVMASELDWQRVLDALARVDKVIRLRSRFFTLRNVLTRKLRKFWVCRWAQSMRLARELGQLKKILIQSDPTSRVGKAPHG